VSCGEPPARVASVRRLGRKTGHRPSRPAASGTTYDENAMATVTSGDGKPPLYHFGDANQLTMFSLRGHPGPASYLRRSDTLWFHRLVDIKNSNILKLNQR
jgi:hypothetical protein